MKPRINYYNKELSRITPAMASKIVAVGEYPITKNVDKKNMAALMRVINTIYNLEETITKT